MGNQLLKGYSLQGEPKSGFGCQKMWRVYQGQKNSTRDLATIFAIQKRSLNKNEKDQLITFAKKEAMGLARIRHPGVLAISETLIEDENVLAFSTQPILGNLTSLCKEKKLKDLISSETELRLNIFPLLDTLKFLHQNVKTAHLAISFHNIYITREGKWKIGGLANSQIFTCDQMELASTYRCSDYSFSAPQIALNNSFSPKSDIYAFGVLLFRLLDLFLTEAVPKFYKTKSEYENSFEKDLMSKLNSNIFCKLSNSEQLNLLMKGMVAKRPQDRISLEEVRTSRWLNDKMVLTVKHLENIQNFENKQQIQFLKGLMGILNDFQSKLLIKRIIPLLIDLLKFKHLIPTIIYISLEMLKEGKMISKEEFRQHLWQHLKKVMQGKEMTAYSIFMFVDNMKVLEPVITLEGLTQSVIPLYVKCFDCPPKLKELALKQTDYILAKMDYQFIKSKMIPKVIQCIKDTNPDIHKKGLIAVRKSLKILDTQTITSIVLPGLESSRKGGSDQFVNAITVSIYQILGKSLPTQILSSKLIPTVLPYLTDPTVKAQNFYNYKNVLMVMMEKIQNQRKKFWNQSDSQPQQVFTAKDFDFQEVKVEENGQTAIGKGDYNFLSQYLEKKKEKTEFSNIPTDNKIQDDPFDFGGTQQVTSSKVEEFKAPVMPVMSNPPKMAEKKQFPTFTANKNVPFSPESQIKPIKSTKLKGPGEPKPIPKKVEEHDPWSSLSTVPPSKPVFNEPVKQSGNADYNLDDWDFGGYKKNTSSMPSYTSPMGIHIGSTTPTYSFDNPSNLKTTTNNSNLFGLSDDPFAELQSQKTSGGMNPPVAQLPTGQGSTNIDWDWSSNVKPSQKNESADFDLI